MKDDDYYENEAYYAMEPWQQELHDYKEWFDEAYGELGSVITGCEGYDD